MLQVDGTTARRSLQASASDVSSVDVMFLFICAIFILFMQLGFAAVCIIPPPHLSESCLYPLQQIDVVCSFARALFELRTP